MFQGFTPETIDFLWGLRLNNRRDWFMEHKEEYQKTLYEPMKELAQEVFEPFLDVPNMSRKVSRIYKDARMHPAVPYKEGLWFSMRPDGLPWSEQPTLFFQIRPERYDFGFLLWHPTAAMTTKWRSLMADRPEEFPQLVKTMERKTGLQFEGTPYCRKKPCPAEILEPYYNLKNMSMEISREPDDLLFSAELAKTVRETLQKLLPMYEYCLKFTMEQ